MLMNSCNRSFIKGFQKVANQKAVDHMVEHIHAGNHPGELDKTHLHLLAKYIHKGPGRIRLMHSDGRGIEIQGQVKTAAPAWYYRMNKTMNPLKSMKNHSVKGLKAIKAAEGLK